jgi:hypothetical protein
MTELYNYVTKSVFKKFTSIIPSKQYLSVFKRKFVSFPKNLSRKLNISELPEVNDTTCQHPVATPNAADQNKSPASQQNQSPAARMA